MEYFTQESYIYILKIPGIYFSLLFLEENFDDSYNNCNMFYHTHLIKDDLYDIYYK